jgi:hypothetical protein
MSEKDKLMPVVEPFYAAIEKSDTSCRPESLKRFPCGSCCETGSLLAQYLYDKNYGDFLLVIGSKNGISHAWLEKDDLIIDITIGQFEQFKDIKIYIGPETDWYREFCPEEKYVAKLENWEFTTNDLRKFYSILVESMVD